jgi:branched-chain amino acid transport system substrate-binding protein
MSKRRFHQGVVIGALMAALAASPAFAQKTIKIGSFLAATGPASFLGDPEKKTLELYVERVNARGGVLGKKLELVLYDTGLNAKQAVTFAKRLVEEDKVDVIIGGTTTGETMAVIKAVNPQLPFVSLAGASVIVDPVKKWVFKTPHTDRMAVDKVFIDMNKRGISKVGVIAGSGGFDKSCMKNAAQLAGERGIEIVASETYGKGDTDMTPQLTKIKNAPGLQGILYCGFGAASSIVTKNHAQLGIQAPLYHNHGSCSKSFIKGAGDAAEGVRLPCAALVVAEQLPGKDIQKSVGLEYAKAYKDRYGEDISTFGGHAFDALFLVVDAITRAGSTDKAKVRDALEQTKEFIGTDGIFNMSPENHLGLDLRSLRMVEVQKGTWKLLY